MVQTAGFVSSALLVQAMTGITMMILARSLSVSSFGNYAFAHSALVFAAIFFEFGFFFAGSRLAATREDSERRELLGGALILFLPVALLFTLSVWGLSLVIDEWFNVSVGAAVRIVAPLTFVYPFDFVALTFAQSFDRLHVYSVATTIGRGILLGAVAALAFTGRGFTVLHVLLLEAVSLATAWTLLSWRLRPVLSNTRRRVAQLVTDARAYGFSVYVGRVLSVSTYNMDVLVVAVFRDAQAVSFYTLGVAMAACVHLPGVGMASALFPRMAREHEIDRRWLMWACVAGAAVALVVVAAARPFVMTVFSERYLPTVPLVGPLALAAMLRGVTAIYNSFLAAHGRGRDLANAALVLTATNLAVNFGLIPRYGARGAAWGSVVALGANLVAHAVFYRRAVLSSPQAPTAT